MDFSKTLIRGGAFAAPASTHTSQRVAVIERLPKSLLCVPLVLQWAWLGLRYRALALPTLVNPGIAFGGLVGESKLACLDLIASDCAAYVAHTAPVRPGDNAETVRRAAKLTFPLIAKPDIGWCGYGVQRLDSPQKLAAYGAAFPKDATYLLQRFAEGPFEAGLAYARMPGATCGRVLALTFRHQPHVIGDGRTALAALIAADSRTVRKMSLYCKYLTAAELARVPALGEHVTLTTIASQRVGALYEDATALVSGELNETIDRIARSMGEFHYGRFDIRFVSVARLQRGEFTIIEINGAGSEAIQYWDPRVPIMAAFAGVFAKQKMLFAIGAAMRRRGAKSVSIAALFRAWRAQQKLMARYPSSN